MLICQKCKKEMQCIKNGVGVRYGCDARHVYRGDRFRCSECGVEIVCTNSNPGNDDLFAKDDIYMNTTYREMVPRSKNLRQMEEDIDGSILQ